MIPLARPYIPKGTLAAIKKVLDSGMLSESKYTEQFERMVAEYTGFKYAIACTSCTTGLEIVLKVLGIGPGDEVMVPDFTYPATAEAVMTVGATPVLVDVDADTCVMNQKIFEDAYTDKIKAVIPVSQFGCPVNISHYCRVIEDAACSLGSTHKKSNIAAVFSFHPRKTITTGEGGIIVTDNQYLAKKLKAYKKFGLEGGVFVESGTNSKLSDLLGVLGVEQMKEIEKIVARRQEIAINYANMIGVAKKHQTNPGVHQSFCVFVKNNKEARKKLLEKGIETQVGSYALHLQPAFRNCKRVGLLENSTWLGGCALTLPMYHTITVKEQERVISELKKVW